MWTSTVFHTFNKSDFESLLRFFSDFNYIISSYYDCDVIQITKTHYPLGFYWPLKF